MLNKDKIFGIMDFVFKEAKSYDTRVLINSGSEGLTRFANSEIHQNVYTSELSVSIVITEGNKRSQISTDLDSEEGLRDAVKEAINNLSFLPEGEEEPALLPGPKTTVNIHINKELEMQFSVEKRALQVKTCLDTLADDYKAYGALSYSERLLAMGNSKGIRHLAGFNNVNFSALIAHDSGGSGYAALTGSSPAELDIKGAFERAYAKAKLNQNPATIEPGAYTVILEPLAVGDLITYLAFMGFSGKSVQNKVSFLTGKIGEKIFAEGITLVDDYTDPNTLHLPFDFEGADRQKVTLIDKGVAKGLVYDLASAAKDEVETTGHSIGSPAYGGMPLNIVMTAGDQSLEEIIAGTEKGLLVTRFHYINPVNPRMAQLTGLTRDGLFKVERGKIVGAIKDMRFTESMFNAFNNVEAISVERERTGFFIGNYYVPALKINNFHFTGKTEMIAGQA